MELIYALGGFVAGVISCAVWLKVTDRLVAKVKDKADEYGDKYL